LVRDSSANTYYLFDNYTPHIQETNILDPNDASLRITTLRSNIISNSVLVRGYDVVDHANAAFATANSKTSNVGTVTSVGGTGTINGLTLTGTVTTSGNLTLGGTLNLSSPPAIGGVTANTGSFSNLSYTGTLTGGTGVVNIGSGQIYKDEDGNVGIGTSSPSEKLVVCGDMPSVLIDSSEPAGSTYLRFADSGVSRGHIEYRNFNHTMRFRTDGADRLLIDATGRLALGSVVPTFLMNIGGASPVFRIHTTTSGINSRSAYLTWTRSTNTETGSVGFRSGGDDVFRISNNNISII
jgi:hypothetical protein